jgi:hypothetical protein
MTLQNTTYMTSARMFASKSTIDASLEPTKQTLCGGLHILMADFAILGLNQATTVRAGAAHFSPGSFRPAAGSSLCRESIPARSRAAQVTRARDRLAGCNQPEIRERTSTRRNGMGSTVPSSPRLAPPPGLPSPPPTRREREASVTDHRCQAPPPPIHSSTPPDGCSCTAAHVGDPRPVAEAFGSSSHARRSSPSLPSPAPTMARAVTPLWTVASSSSPLTETRGCSSRPTTTSHRRSASPRRARTCTSCRRTRPPSESAPTRWRWRRSGTSQTWASCHFPGAMVTWWGRSSTPPEPPALC